MPLPLFLGIAAGVAALGGVGTGIHGAVKMKDANDTIKAAESRHKKNLQKFETRNKQTTKQMDTLGKKEIEILSTFERFSDLFEKIQNRPEFDDVVLNGNVLPKYNGEELKKVSVGASALMAGLGGAALGTAGGFAAAGATTAAVMALGTASTGTAIATLSGAAATNATLAALGGGALAAGGGGIALGTTMLGVATAGVGLLVGGIVFNMTGSSISNKADKAYDEMLKAEKQINTICNYLDDLKTTSKKYFDTLCKVDGIYRKHLNGLEYCVDFQNKTDWLTYTEDEKLLIKNTVMLVGLLYKMCNVKLVLASKNDNETNSVNHKQVSEICETANSVTNEFVAADALFKIEKYCIATAAVITYFAECDGSISEEEKELLADTNDMLHNISSLSGESLSIIDDILSNGKCTFYQMCAYLDTLSIDEILTFDKLIKEVIEVSGGITESELKAKKKFDSYLEERKLNN